MPAPRRRGVYDRVEYIVVERDDVKVEGQVGDIDLEEPTATVDQHLRRSFTRRQAPSPTDVDYESDDEDDYYTTTRPTLTAPTGPAGYLITTTLPQSQITASALADSDPTETIVVSLPPPPRPPRSGDREGRISQTTEHLLIAAGSIGEHRTSTLVVTLAYIYVLGATIVIVMVILGLYTMRKRGLTFRDVVQHGKRRMHRGPTPPPKYGMDNKQSYEDDYPYSKPLPAAIISRSGSLSTQRPLQALDRSDSSGQRGLERNDSTNKSFYNDAPSRQNSHRRDISATPSSPVLPIQNMRRSDSTRNTRSLDGNEEQLRYSDPPHQQAPLPAPPTFRQFLSNRPSISQRPGIGGAMMSRFSWTNSNAPQTPHDPSRDTVAQPIGRDSFMTQRSSVPRFRTVDSWVNQQSNRVEAQRLKQQFRMTQSSTSSGEGDDVDEVPEMPAVPKKLKEASGLAGKDIRHQRHDTTTTVQTAPIFKAHPGTEVRFSVRSTVPSEVLDMGRKNAAL
ncbi:Nn.00g104200.m01.CDS01 [Neocucurbitaria sp. VM-36]